MNRNRKIPTLHPGRTTERTHVARRSFSETTDAYKASGFYIGLIVGGILVAIYADRYSL